LNRGYVKVWRKIEDSGLIQLPNTLALFMHLLLNATHKDRKVGTPIGVFELKRGQYISGRIALAAKLQQTEREVRTSIARLQELNIITVETTSKFSIYTIENYSKYQDVDITNDQQNDQQTTSKRPASDQQTTTKQELNNLNIEALNKNITQKNEFFAEFWLAYPKKTAKGAGEKAFTKNKINRETLTLILTALQWQKESEQWRKGYIPNPATYINDKRWLDEPVSDGLEDFYNEPRFEKDITNG